MVKSDDLLASGLFPVELPTGFTTRSFATVQSALTTPRPKAGTWTVPAPLNLARPGSLRRRLSIPNPFSQSALTELIANDWVAIEAHLKKSRLSLSRPVVDSSGARALTMRTAFGDRTKERARRMHRGRYVLMSDIAGFYASIYTHSIEWALDGKSASKARLKTKMKLRPRSLSEDLDVAVRNGQDGQTKGIPVSPDTSLVLAEIILTAVDEGLQKAHPEIERVGSRFIDDFEVYTNSQAQAEDILLTWQALLAEFELTVNPEKTSITEGPVSIESPWRTKLSQFQFRSSSDLKAANDLRSFFSQAFVLARENRQEPVLGYAVSLAGAQIAGKESWSALQQLMLAAAIVDPSCLRYVASILQRGLGPGAPLERRRLAESLSEVCDFHARREHGSEVTWALWIMRRLGLHLTEDAALNISKMQDNCSLLLLFDMIDLKLADGKPPDMSTAVARAEATGAWHSEDWLLGYECARNSWSSDKAIKSQPQWKEILGLNIEFFKRGAPPTTATSARKPSGAAAKKAAAPTPSGAVPPTPLPSSGSQPLSTTSTVKVPGATPPSKQDKADGISFDSGTSDGEDLTHLGPEPADEIDWEVVTGLKADATDEDEDWWTVLAPSSGQY